MWYSVQDYLKLCADVYFPVAEFLNPAKEKPGDINKKTYDGFYRHSILQKQDMWVRVAGSTLQSNGFFAAYYVKLNYLSDFNDVSSYMNHKHGVIAIRGSDDIVDFAYHDCKLILNEWPLVLEAARNFQIDIIDEYNPKFLSFTGHSLGGAIAQLLGIELNNNRTGKLKYPVVCFNSPQTGYLVDYNYNKTVKSDLDNIFSDIDPLSALAKITLPSIINTHDLTSINALCSEFKLGITNFFDYFTKILNYRINLLLNQGYSGICQYKNLKYTAAIGQVGFNAIYDMASANVDAKLLDQINMADYHKKSKIKYEYIYNFNALYDGVNCLGLPVGNSFVFDVDEPNSKFAPLRVKAELRTLSTLAPEYFNNKKILLTEQIQKTTNNPSSAEVTQCFYNLKSLPNLSVKNTIDYMPFLLVRLFLYKYILGDTLSESAYYFGKQHVLSTLAPVLLKNEYIRPLKIDPDGYDFSAAFSRYRAKYPLIDLQSDLPNKITANLHKLNLDKYINCQ